MTRSQMDEALSVVSCLDCYGPLTRDQYQDGRCLECAASVAKTKWERESTKLLCDSYVQMLEEACLVECLLCHGHHDKEESQGVYNDSDEHEGWVGDECVEKWRY